MNKITQNGWKLSNFSTQVDSILRTPETAKKAEKSSIIMPTDFAANIKSAYDKHHAGVSHMITASINEKKNKEIADAGGSVRVGTPSAETAPGFEAWLPFAAKQLHISPNPKDYLLYITPVMPTDLPNANGVGFPARQLVKWNRDRGQLAYQTMQRMPMHIEHASEDMTKAAGVVVDTAMTKLTGFANDKLWKMMALVAIDLKKTDIARKFESGEMNTYSMGSMVGGYYCSYCGADLGDCSHIQEGEVAFYELNGKLVYKLVRDVEFFEFSMVADPAYGIAQSDIRIKGY